ncbi:Cobalt transport protein CbiQ [Polystyrenella longa]|uniref:Cobalt transport protein CbiQ n=1 Tax=Polystyrenella longa TaxID=2528007 RepID=A0A518CPJ9_9PLAN|nr:energy-coupling factor transporter transmembrane component T [Polystyrenella longa]QDU81157.1 Cobalt transport protein CbiQ [Polystyrenella longa]
MSDLRFGERARLLPAARHATIKLIIVLLLIVTAVCTPVSWWPLWGAILLIEVGLLIRNPPDSRFWWPRLPVFVLFLGSVALSIPLSQHFEQGWLRAAMIFERGMLAFLATTWLTTVLTPLELIHVLRRWKMPPFLVESLAFMLRYLNLLSTERKTLQQARAARAGKKTGLITAWKTSAYIIATVLVRAFDRAERIYLAMKARGWKGL